MTPDAITPVSGGVVPPRVPAVTPTPGTGFVAALQAQLAPEDLPTLTFGEMTGVGAAVPAASGPTAVGAVPAVVPGADGARVLTWPVRGRISSTFGPRVHPVTGASRDHRGLDIAAPTGTPVVAAAAGTVTFAGIQGGYGNVVVIDHGNGLETRYAHQDTVAVSAGQRVGAGERVGAVGSTGLSTGPHLHFEVRRDGAPVDPDRYLG